MESKEKVTMVKLKDCTKCPTLGKNHVPPSGPPTADIMIVGQSPGEQEVAAGRPFVGPSGELLTYMLDSAGLDMDEVYITNALKCHPPGNRPGSQDELETCFDTWLKGELIASNPKFVIILGKDAYYSVTRGKIPFSHGGIHKTKKRTIITLYHPSYFLRRGDIETFVSFGKELKQLLMEGM